MSNEQSLIFVRDTINALGNIEPPEKEKRYSMYETSEIKITLQALKTCFWCRTAAAEAVGVTYRIFSYMCTKYKIQHPFWLGNNQYDNIHKLHELVNGNGKEND